MNRSPPPDPHAAVRAAAEREVRESLANSTSTAFLATAPLLPVPGGLSNFSWRADASGRDFFVRLAHPAGVALGADHFNERVILQLAAGARIAPPVVLCDPASRVLVTEWIATGDEFASAPMDSHALANVARTVARLHALPASGSMRQVDFAVQARTLETSLDGSREDLRRDGAATARERVHTVRKRTATSERALRDAARTLFERFAASAAALVPCHHDLNPLNLLFDRTGRLWIVDWEYAGLGDPALDLASFACQHGLTPGQRRRLTGDYRDAGGAVDDARFDLACWLFDYVQWLWYRAAQRTDAALTTGSLARDRAHRLGRALRGRATRLLRCNNAVLRERE